MRARARSPWPAWTAARCGSAPWRRSGRAITSGQYRPGDHLSEVELGNKLGVNRGTVREALRHLQQEGVITVGSCPWMISLIIRRENPANRAG